jgi:hypothetical protein
MSIAYELSGEVAIAVLTGRDVEKTAELLGTLLQVQSTLRALSREERERRHSKLLPGGPPAPPRFASAGA